MKFKIKEVRGITLITLVITIIVLLILAGVTIATLTGDNGIIRKAENATEETRGASVEEAKNLWKMNQEANHYAQNETAQSLEELINDLVKEKLLTNEEKNQILGNAEKNIEAKGEVTIGSKRIVFKYFEIGKMVSVGDFVNYKAGDWTNEDITKLGDYYAGKAVPITQPCKFGGFEVGDSKDSTLVASSGSYQNIYERGWRILSKNEDGSVNIVHAGTPEGYCQEYGTNCAYKNQWILGGGKNENDASNITEGIIPRDWSMYEDSKYAKKGSARSISSEINNINKSSDLRTIGVSYWYSFAGSKDLLCFISADGYRFANQYYNASMGIRPIVTIKPEVVVDPNGKEKHVTPETAWNLILE